MAIHPRTSEKEWAPHLAHLPELRVSGDPVVIISPHPDDETLGAGGLIAALRSQGVEVVVIAVTDGENAYAGDPGLASLREQEQTLALQRLGVPAASILRLRLPDSGLAACEDQLVAAFIRAIPGGAHVIAPWPHDFHPDHEVCGRAATAAAEHVGATLSFYFFWTWHRGDEGTLDGLSLHSFSLDAAQQTAKREALACHRSQLHRETGDPILPANLLGPAYRPFEVFLPR